ncbi:MAG TPA: hypothetical protein VIJ29_04695 [Candidatus Paceibacterota bacterium]
MNELDQFIKHDLKVRNYVRYTDDFVIVAESREYLEHLVLRIELFLQEELLLTLHPRKIILQPFHRGIDFLGYVTFPHHRLVRTKTKKRILKKMRESARKHEEGIITKTTLDQSLQSYLGVLSHASAHQLREKIINEFWIF